MNYAYQIERIPRWLQHLAFWVIYIVLQSAIWKGYGDFRTSLTGHLIELPGKLVIVYYNICFLIPSYLFRGRIFRYVGGLMLGLMVAALVQRFIEWFIYPPLIEYQLLFPEFFISMLWVAKYTAASTYDVFITGGIKIIKEFYSQRHRTQELESKQLKTELDFLKYQINPHFFFNTLNNLYGMALKKDDNTPQLILKLSDMMSFVLYDASPPLIPISKEIKGVHDYIELEKLRHGKDVSITFHDICEKDHMLPPLLLLPLVENAFKHGRPAEDGIFFINILLTSNANEIEFIVENCVNDYVTASSKGGIGLSNLRRRLQLMYPGKYELAIRGPHNHLFMVKLKIKMN